MEITKRGLTLSPMLPDISASIHEHQEARLAKPRAFISSLTFSGGKTITLKPEDKVLLVGPNNSGKSITLREILKEIGNYGTNTKIPKYSDNDVIKDIKLKIDATPVQIRNFFDTECEPIHHYIIYGKFRIPKTDSKNIENIDNSTFVELFISRFIKMIGAEERLSISNVKHSVAYGQEKNLPQHFLYDDDDLMDRVSGLFRNAFDKDLFIDFRGGSVIPIHVGEKPTLKSGEERISESYVKKVRVNPLLHEQGDGMKSYTGLLFETVVTEQDVTLIDEPEAFLHPPQMRKLGETLSSEVGGQLVVATHSSDIMRGFFTGKPKSVRILRIQRTQRDDAEVNEVTEVLGESIRRLWEEPALRYSNALDGIFHEQVVICEDDSDCRLFNAVADSMTQNSDDVWKDTAYVPAGGKHGIPRIAKMLRGTGVRTIAVFDIDFLSGEELVKKTVEAFGGNWVDIRPLWTRLDAEVRNGTPRRTNDDIKASIREVLDSSDKGALPKSDIESLLKSGNPWAKAKESGTHGMPKGQAQEYFEELDAKLREMGIFVVPVGEVEGFCREIGGHGPKFVNDVLKRNLADDPKLDELRSFVRKVHGE